MPQTDILHNFADLDNADFNLNFADMAYADLRNSVLNGANLNFVDLDGANIDNIRILLIVLVIEATGFYRYLQRQENCGPRSPQFS